MVGGRTVLFLCLQHYKKLPAVATVAKFSRAVVGQFFKTLNGDRETNILIGILRT